MNKIYRLYILIMFCSAAGAFAFADQPSSSLDDKPSVDAAANTVVQVPAVTSDATATEAHPSYLYDLKKLIEKSRANIKEVNQKIMEQAVLKRNQKREERAREYYEKGVQLTNEGKLDEAREYFEKAIRITEHPEMAGYIKESQRRLRKQEDALHHQEAERYNQIKQDANTRKEDVEAAYKEAVDLYKQKKYHPAKDAFEHVDEIAPDYRATSSYLKIIDQDIITSDAIAAKQQAVEIEHQQKEAEAARAKEKQMWLAQIEEKEKERKDSVNKQAADVYDQAVELYKNKKFAQAKKKFEEVSWVIPDYKATMKYLSRIDHDAELEQQRIAKEQQQALQEQRWQEEVEQRKEEALRKKELEIKEQQHQSELQEQAQFLYKGAVALFDKGQMKDALEKFHDIEKLVPDYKSTKAYIARIQENSIEQKNKNSQAQNAYKNALDLYRSHQWQDARTQFESVEQLIPDYKSTHRYLHKIDDFIAKEEKKSQEAKPQQAKVIPPTAVELPKPQVVVTVTPIPVAVKPPVESNMPSQVKVAVSMEDQQRQAQDIAAMVEKSAQLLNQIADVADDKSTVQVKRKMARVDDILKNLKESKERLLRQMRDAQWKRQQEESKAKQEERRQEAEKTYREAVEFLRSHDYSKAKIKFLQLENIIPDYKSTRRYLKQIDKDQGQANVEAVTNYEKNEAEHLKRLQDKENIALFQRAQQEQQKELTVEEQQQASLKILAQKASDINDDILRLSQSQDFEAMKVKFAELENTVTALTTLKDEMAKFKDHKERDKQLARETIRHRKELLSSQRREDQEIHAYYRVQPLKEYRPVLSVQSADADQYKRREISQEQNMLFSEGVDCYEHKKYSQAKLLFGELADKNDRRAEAWLKKVDRAITRQLLKSQEGEERERTAFIEEQVRAQRELIVIQERERQRQKKLTEELEHQKRIYEDDRELQIRKEQTMKIQERERQRQEEKRLKLEKESEKREELLRFHKIIPKVTPPVVQAVVAAPVVAAPAVIAPVAAVVPTAMTAKQIQDQIDFSNKRKAFLDNQYKKQQQEKDRQAKIKADQDALQAKLKADADARQKRIEARQKEIADQKELRAKREEERQASRKAEADARQKRKEAREKERQHQQELRAQREAQRQAELKAAAEARAIQAKAEADRLAQAEKQREEKLRQDEQERQERVKQEQILREEAQRREELERQERQRQAQLEAQREAVRKELENGVEAMYQEALSLYKQGEYTAAADRFKDVQDILPGYKRSEQYMDDARQKALAPAPVVVQQDNASKALDLIDPNAK